MLSLLSILLNCSQKLFDETHTDQNQHFLIASQQVHKSITKGPENSTVYRFYLLVLLQYRATTNLASSGTYSCCFKVCEKISSNKLEEMGKRKKRRVFSMVQCFKHRNAIVSILKLNNIFLNIDLDHVYQIPNSSNTMVFGKIGIIFSIAKK